MAAALGLLAWVALAGGAGSWAQSPPAPTEEVTAPPAPTELPLPPTAPAPDRDEDEDEAPPPPPAEPATATVLATHTRRPTRTPRTTATPTPTAAVAGALRLTLAQEPALAAPGGGLTLRLSLTNRDLGPAGDLTLELTLPQELGPGPARTADGQVVAADRLIRWYLPRLDPGATAVLELPADALAVTGPESRACALLLSAASPLEHCIPVRVVPATPTPAPSEDALGDGYEGAVPEPGGLPPTLGWVAVLGGLVALGAWLGLRRRA